MRQKDKLNLNNVKALFEENQLKNVLKVGSKMFKGASGGLGASGIVITILALAGITAAAIFEIIGAVTGVVLFAGLGAAIAIYQLRNEQKERVAEKNILEKKLGLLRKTVIDLIANYQRLNETENDIDAQLIKLKNIDVNAELQDEDESKKVKEKIREYEKDKQALLQARNEVILRLKICLTVVSGNENTTRLSSFFGEADPAAGKEAVYQYAQSTLGFPQAEIDRVKRGLSVIWGELNSPSPSTFHSQQAVNQLSHFLQEQQGRRPRLDRTLSLGLTGMVGFIAGSGIAVAVAGFALGGMAALLAVGWPIIIPIVAGGIVGGVVTAVSYRSIKKAQEKAHQKIQLVIHQVGGVSDYISELTRNTSQRLESFFIKEKVARTEAAIRLKDVERDLLRYEGQIETTIKGIVSLEREIKEFQVVHQNFQGAKSLKKDLQQCFVLLDDLEKRLHGIAIISGSEDKKLALLEKTSDLLQKGKGHLKKIEMISQDILKGLHKEEEKKTPEGSPVEVEQSVETESQEFSPKSNYSAQD